jgi:hypothetical protein
VSTRAVLTLVGTLVIGEYLAGAVITVMLASGRTLEALAAGRAQRELRALLARAPRVVHRYEAVSHFIRRLGCVLDDLDPQGPDTDDITELGRLLYGLHAILRLHFAQEDEGYLSLVDDKTPKHDAAQRRAG